MQIQSLRMRSYRSWHINETVVSETAKERLTKLTLFEQLRSEGCSEKTALKAIQVARATLYRWKKEYRHHGLPGLNPKSTKPKTQKKITWSKELQALIFRIRRDFPFWGKLKIHRLLERDYKIHVSLSMVGRILKKLIDLKRILPVSKVLGRNQPKRKRIFNNHAKRWKYGQRATKPGELIQIDHMTVYSDYGRAIKHFQAVCPVSKVMVTGVYSNATSLSATRFLEKVIAEMPFSVYSIQVDGGSEFMQHFEIACAEKNIPLFVLPPRSPKYNGVVERNNGTARGEFYSQYRGEFVLVQIREELQAYQAFYNGFRPHQALGNLTPMEYIESVSQIRAA